MSRSYNNNRAAAPAAAYNDYEEDENLAFLPADHVILSLHHFAQFFSSP